jgi:NlpC/P60 family putative phage cell wall peptidase
MTTRGQIVDEARAWIGTPFHHQASLKGVGCDCIGLLRGIGRAFDLPGSKEIEGNQEFLGYGPDPDPVLLMKGCDLFLRRIGRSELLLGDILLFRTPFSKGEPKHFGVISSMYPMYIVHSWAGLGSCTVENRVDRSWESRIIGCFRFKGLD